MYIIKSCNKFCLRTLPALAPAANVIPKVGSLYCAFSVSYAVQYKAKIRIFWLLKRLKGNIYDVRDVETTKSGSVGWDPSRQICVIFTNLAH